MKPTILCIMDGWGISSNAKYNAVTQAKTPISISWLDNGQIIVMHASGEHVGLPEGQMGRSGTHEYRRRPCYSAGPAQINKQSNQTSYLKTVLKDFISATKNPGKCHLIELLSDGGVHSHQTHIEALAKTIASSSVPVVLQDFRWT